MPFLIAWHYENLLCPAVEIKMHNFEEKYDIVKLKPDEADED